MLVSTLSRAGHARILYFPKGAWLWRQVGIIRRRRPRSRMLMQVRRRNEEEIVPGTTDSCLLQILCAVYLQETLYVARLSFAWYSIFLGRYKAGQPA
jgi:hypothetical protein